MRHVDKVDIHLVSHIELWHEKQSVSVGSTTNIPPISDSLITVPIGIQIAPFFDRVATISACS